MRVARLLFPAIRWDNEGGFEGGADSIDRALELGVGGFIIFGGPASEVRDLIGSIRARSTVPLLFGADLERGAGQQFRGATPLPPLAALGSLNELETVWRAGNLTAREARAIGLDWVYAPDADLDIEPRNPIVGTRALGSDPELVTAQLTAWIEGCRAGGALSCAKHFPGHGRTTSDSHIGLPIVTAERADLEADLTPFRGAIGAGVDSIMTAHVSYPALDPSGVPATLSGPIVTGLLREELKFGGLIVTDALIMEGVRGGGHPGPSAAVRAVAAGCDVLLYPGEPEVVVAELRGALGRELNEARVAESIGRIEAAAERAARSGDTTSGGWGRAEDHEWSLEAALRIIRVVRGPDPGWAGVKEIGLLTIDDDLGGPYPPPSRSHLVDSLDRGGMAAREVVGPSCDGPVGPGEVSVPLLIALYSDIRGWKGRPGLSEPARSRLAEILAERPDAAVLLFGHPRLVSEIPPSSGPVIAAWGGENLVQEAMATWILERCQEK